MLKYDSDSCPNSQAHRRVPEFAPSRRHEREPYRILAPATPPTLELTLSRSVNA